MNDNKKLWSDNLDEEKEFWHSLASKSIKSNTEWIKNFHSRAANDARFPPNLEKFLPDDQKHIKVLDVGAGPITQLGSLHNWRTIDITPIDPLADYYHSLLTEFNIHNIRATTIFGEAENLSELFKTESFDLVYTRNAMDHSYNPLLGIKEMIYVAKVGASCWLTGSINEGEKNNYQGLHQWNFQPTPEGNDLIIWNPDENYSIKKELQDQVKIFSSGEQWFNARILRVC